MIAVTVPVQVQIPPTLNLSDEMLAKAISSRAQNWVDDLVENTPRFMSRAEMEATSVSLEDSRAAMLNRVHRFYQEKVKA